MAKKGNLIAPKSQPAAEQITLNNIPASLEFKACAFFDAWEFIVGAHSASDVDCKFENFTADINALKEMIEHDPALKVLADALWKIDSGEQAMNHVDAELLAAFERSGSAQKKDMPFPESSICAHLTFFKMYNDVTRRADLDELFSGLRGLEVLIQNNPAFKSCRDGLQKMASGFYTIRQVQHVFEGI